MELLRKSSDPWESQPSLSRRSYQGQLYADSWNEILEAGPYYERISELLEDAQHYAIFVGWQIDSRLPMKRPRPPSGVPPMESLKEKILRLVEEKPDFHFYFLMWDHAYFYILEREPWQGRVWDEIHPRVHFVFDNRHPFGGSHHEKLSIIDNTAFCGGIDLCDERWDTPQHLFKDPRRSLAAKSEHHGPYHDVAVEVTGSVVFEIQRHVRERWNAISSIPFPIPLLSPRSPNAHSVYLSRTQVDVDFCKRSPIIREIEFLFRDLIHSAQKRIILEGQYYWSEEINGFLIAKLYEKAGTDFEIILILADVKKLKSLTYQMTPYELSLLHHLQEAARITGAKLTLGSPYVFPSKEDLRVEPNLQPKPIYIHSKVMIIDDRFISIGSANLATRALRLDTEINLTFEAKTDAERNHVREFSEKIRRHWSHDEVRLIALKASSDPRDFLIFLPWKALLDPKQPWLFPVARKLRRYFRHPVVPLMAAIFGVWLPFFLFIGSAVSFLNQISPTPLLWMFAAALSSVWFSKVPFTLLAVLGIFCFKPEVAIDLAVFSLWTAGLCGYSIARLFPTYTGRFLMNKIPNGVPHRLGQRRFSDTLAVTADPWLSIRSKIAYQGLLCVPFPWFVLNLTFVLPAAMYLLMRVVSSVVN